MTNVSRERAAELKSKAKPAPKDPVKERIGEIKARENKLVECFSKDIHVMIAGSKEWDRTSFEDSLYLLALVTRYREALEFYAKGDFINPDQFYNEQGERAQEALRFDPEEKDVSQER